MKPQADQVGRGLRTRRCLQVSALALIALSMSGCVTLGYDFVKQQATVTVTPSTKGYAK
jgi:hypothetical protein